MNMAIIDVLYDRLQSSYRGTKVMINRNERIFNDGLIEYDFLNALNYAKNTLGATVSFSSSCTDFVHDGFCYGWKISEQGETIYKLTEEEIKRYNRKP